MKVYKPEPQEIAKLIELGKDMWAESNFYATGEFDEVAVIAFSSYLYTNDDVLVLAVKATEDGGPVGMLVGQKVPYFFAPSKFMAVDHIVYVAPEHRGSSAAVRLLRGFVEWAEAKDVLELRLGVSTGVNPERTGKLYEKLGFANIGGIFTKRLI